MEQAVDVRGEKLVEHRLHLPRAVVTKLKRQALDRSEREGRTWTWAAVVREALSRLANVEVV